MRTDPRTNLFCTGFAACLALGWLAPNHYFPWLAFQSDWMAGAGLAICCAGALFSSRAPRGTPLAAVVVLAVAVVPPLQWAFGLIHFAGDAWVASLYLAGLALAVHAGWSAAMLRVRAALAPLAWALVIAGLLSVGLAAAQWMHLDGLGILIADADLKARPFANLGQPNQLATLLVLGIIGAALLHHWQRLGNASLLAISAMFAFGIALTQSRSGQLQLVVVLGWLLVQHTRSGLRIGRRQIVAIAAFAALFVTVLPRINAQLDSFQRTSADRAASSDRRVLHMQTMLDAIARQPLAGYGWNQAAVAAGRVAADHPITNETIEHSHSLALDLLVWNGVPLGALLIAAVAWWLWRHARACRDARQALLLAALGALLVHAVLEYPLEYAYFLLPFGFMAGVLEAVSPARRSVAAPRAAIGGVALAALGVFGWLTSEYVVVEDNMRVLRMESARIGTSRINSEAPDLVLLTQLRDYLRYARIEAGRGMPAEQLDWMRKVSERYGHPPVLFRYALAAALNGQPEVARRTLARLCKVNAPERCKEARLSWTALAADTYPELAGVPVPHEE